METDRSNHLFLIKMWQEPGVTEFASEVVWRGSVQHVRSGERIYFRQLADLNEFIRGQLSRPHLPERRTTGDDNEVDN